MQKRHFNKSLLAAGLTALIALVASEAFSQSQNTADGRGQQPQAGERDLDRDRVRDQLHSRIDSAPGLSENDRAGMQRNLDACLALDIPVSDLGAIFPEDNAGRQTSAQVMPRLQSRVINAAREGIVVEPILAKVREGRTKGVSDQLLEQVCDRMEQHLRTTNRIMNRLADAGVDPPADAEQRRELHREMAQQLWRGMNEPDYDAIPARMRERTQSRDCAANDVVAAGEVAARLFEAGVDHGRAVQFAGSALEHGYRHQELRQIQHILAARYHRGEPMTDLLDGLEYCVGEGMGSGEMYNYMIRHGWMGPGDMYGPGGNQPMDTKGHGGMHGGNTGGNDNTGHKHGGNNRN